MNISNRFILRKEYFGGIIYDKKMVRTDVIMQHEWDILMGLNSGRKGKKALQEALMMPANKELRTIVAKMRKDKALDADFNLNTDIYVAPYPIVDGVLVSPLRTYLHITDGCNLRCTHCMFSCGKRLKNELTKEELFEVIKILKDVRCPELRITGGEPVVREDLFEVTKKAKESDLYVMLNTNGVYGEKIWRKLISSGIDEIIISLEGKEAEHDKRRGTGSFKKVMKTIKFLADYNKMASEEDKIKLTLNQTFGRSNLRDFEFVARLAARVGANVNLMPLRPFGTTKVRLMDDMLSPVEFRDFMEEIMRMRADPEIVDKGIKIISKNFDLFADCPDASHLPKPFDRSRCGAAGFGLGINSDGEIDVCGFLSKIPEFYGPNILNTPFYHVWMSPKIHNFRTVVKRYCEPCPYYRRQCVGACMAMAFAETGDLGGKDRYCFAHLIKR